MEGKEFIRPVSKTVDLPKIRQIVSPLRKTQVPWNSLQKKSNRLRDKIRLLALNDVSQTKRPHKLKEVKSQPLLSKEDLGMSVKDRKEISVSVRRYLHKRSPHNASNVRFQEKKETNENMPLTAEPSFIQKRLRNSVYIPKTTYVPSIPNIKPVKVLKNTRAINFVDNLASSCSKYFDEISQDSSLNTYPRKLAKLKNKSNVFFNGIYEYCIASRPLSPQHKVTLKEVKAIKQRGEPPELDLENHKNLEGFLRRTNQCSHFIRKLRQSKLWLEIKQ